MKTRIPVSDPYKILIFVAIHKIINEFLIGEDKWSEVDWATIKEVIIHKMLRCVRDYYEKKR